MMSRTVWTQTGGYMVIWSASSYWICETWGPLNTWIEDENTPKKCIFTSVFKYLKGCYRAKLHVTFVCQYHVSLVLTDVQVNKMNTQVNVYVFTPGMRANALIHHHQSPTSCRFHKMSPVTGNSLKSHLYSWQINSKTTSPAWMHAAIMEASRVIYKLFKKPWKNIQGDWL